jgi:hypothetical protein
MKENKFVIINFNTMEVMKKEGQTWTFDTEQEAILVCGMWELEDVWVIQLKYNYQEIE